jgi:DNA polymerase III alpha subunit
MCLPISKTKDGDPMQFVSFKDTTDIDETVFFPKEYNQLCPILNEMRPYIFKAKAEEDFDAFTLAGPPPDHGLYHFTLL